MTPMADISSLLAYLELNDFVKYKNQQVLQTSLHQEELPPCHESTLLPPIPAGRKLLGIHSPPPGILATSSDIATKPGIFSVTSQNIVSTLPGVLGMSTGIMATPFGVSSTPESSPSPPSPPSGYALPQVPRVPQHPSLVRLTSLPQFSQAACKASCKPSQWETESDRSEGNGAVRLFCERNGSLGESERDAVLELSGTSPWLDQKMQQGTIENQLQQQQLQPIPPHRKLDRRASEPATTATSASLFPGETIPTGTQLSLKAAANLCRYKSELCRPYEEHGTCKYGDKCQFAHGRHELRSMIRHPKYKTDMCKTYHTTGLCPYGPRCHFIHNDEERQLSEANRALIDEQRGRLLQLQQLQLQQRQQVQQIQLTAQIRELQRRMVLAAASQREGVHAQRVARGVLDQAESSLTQGIDAEQLLKKNGGYEQDGTAAMMSELFNHYHHQQQQQQQQQQQGAAVGDRFGSTADSSGSSLTDESPPLSPTSFGASYSQATGGSDGRSCISLPLIHRPLPPQSSALAAPASDIFYDVGGFSQRASERSAVQLGGCATEAGARSREALTLIARRLQTGQLSPAEVAALIGEILHQPDLTPDCQGIAGCIASTPGDVRQGSQPYDVGNAHWPIF